MAGKVAVLHFKSKLGDLKYNLDRLHDLSSKAFDRGVSLVVGPELATCGFSFRDLDSIRPYALESDSNDFSKLKELAKVKKGYIIFGYAELGQDNKVYNSALVLGPSGVEASHRQRISKFFGWVQSSGEKDTVFDTSVGKIGVLICPELAVDKYVRQLKKMETDLIVVPMNWYPENDLLSEWKKIARKNKIFLVLANRFGKEKTKDFSIDFDKSISAVIDQYGNVKALADSPEENILLASLE